MEWSNGGAELDGMASHSTRHHKNRPSLPAMTDADEDDVDGWVKSEIDSIERRLDGQDIASQIEALEREREQTEGELRKLLALADTSDDWKETMLLNLVRLCLVWGIAAVWWSTTDDIQKGAAIVAATAFSLIETTWTSITDEVPGQSTVCFKLKEGHTTWSQWWCNIMYTPVLLFFYRGMITTAWLRVLLYPLNVWLLELVEGSLLTILFGRNTAWHYVGADAFCWGNIKLTYGGVWWGLGVVVEFAWRPVLIPLATAVGGDATVVLLCAVPVTFLSDWLLGWPILSIPPPLKTKAR